MSCPDGTIENSNTHHNVHFLLHLREHGLIRDSDPFENMVGCVVDWGCGPDEVYMCETTWSAMWSLRLLGWMAAYLD